MTFEPNFYSKNKISFHCSLKSIEWVINNTVGSEKFAFFISIYLLIHTFDKLAGTMIEYFLLNYTILKIMEPISKIVEHCVHVNYMCAEYVSSEK